MLVTMIGAALVVDGIFSLAGLIPTERPGGAELFAGIEANYKLYLNLLGLMVFAGLFALSMRGERQNAACEAHGH